MDKCTIYTNIYIEDIGIIKDQISVIHYHDYIICVFT